MTLTRIMREKKVRTRSLAEMTGIDYYYLTQIRAGNRNLTIKNAKLIADALEINVLDLLYPQDAERQETGSESTAEVSV